MKGNISKSLQLKILVYVIMIISMVIGSTNLKIISATVMNPYLDNQTPSYLNNLSNGASQKCLESSTNLNGLKISSYFTGKYTFVHLGDDYNPRPSIRHLSKIIGNALTNHDKIALVFPTFTTAAYFKSFYDFYRKHIDTPAEKNVTEDLDLLSTRVNNQISPIASGDSMLFLIKNIKSTIPNLNLNLLSDQDVDNGCIFTNDSKNMIDVIILGHQEYVTQKEYNNLKKFVATGGTLILLDGNVFYAEVKYDNNTNKITLVKGHSWAFNGKTAWRSVNERWQNETSQWIGSNYLSISSATFMNDPFEYLHHEEQSITNPKDNILLDYKMVNSPGNVTKIAGNKVLVAAYELNYMKGKVYSIGIYSDDVIHNLKFDKYFDGLLVKITQGKTISTRTVSEEHT